MGTRKPVSWDDLRVLLAVQRRGSHGAAGRLLGIDPTTVGRRITNLEGAFGSRLFDRTPAGLAPTREGALLLVHAARVEEAILAAERELSGSDARLSGSVRVTASDGMVHYLLIPAMGELGRTQPGISLELRADTRVLDLSRREADIAIRLARPKEPSLVARRFGAAHFRWYASRSYLERRGTPRTAADLSAHDLLGFDAALDDLPQQRWLRKTVPSPRWALRATTATAQAVACAEGLGIALLGTYIAPREPRLLPLLPSSQPPARETWLVVHQDMKKSARVAAVLAWLTSIEPLLSL